MALPRAVALRNLRTRIVQGRSLHRFGRRTYASASHSHAKPTGDAVWATVALAITIPTTWYILSTGAKGDHGDHGDHHGSSHGHDDEVAKEHDEEEHGETEKTNEAEDKDADAPADSQGQESSSEDDGAETPEASDDEEKLLDDDEKNVRMHIPDAKGGAKARIQSKAGMKQGGLSQEAANDPSKPDDTAASSKPAGNMSTQSGKQEGISNTDTKHSEDIETSSEKSSKGDGSPETSKAKGTVDVNQPVK